MGRPILYEVVEKPATSCLIILCTAVWLYIQKHGIGYSDVGISYEAVVESGQYWRVVTAAFSHISFIHLMFNMSALWSLGIIENPVHAQLGVRQYLKYTVLLVFLSGALVLGMYHVLSHRFRMERYKRVTAVGYSCVVFGLMTILSCLQPSSNLNLLGLLNLPISFAPFESLIFTSIIVPQASFVGHLAGIIVGYLIGWGLFQGISDFWALTGTIWLGIAFVASLKRSSPFQLDWIQVETVSESAPPVRLVGGVLQRPPTGNASAAVARVEDIV